MAMQIEPSIWRFDCGIGDFTLLPIIGNFRVIFFDFTLLLRRKKAVRRIWARSSCAATGVQVSVHLRRVQMSKMVKLRGPIVGLNEIQTYLHSLSFLCVSPDTARLHLNWFSFDFAANSNTLSSDCQGNGFPILSIPPITLRHLAKLLELWIHHYPIMHRCAFKGVTCSVRLTCFPYRLTYANDSHWSIMRPCHFNFNISRVYIVLQRCLSLLWTHWGHMRYLTLNDTN